MEAWTDGSTHVIAGSEAGLTVFDGTTKRIENSEIAQEWKTLLAVDVDADAVWTGSPAGRYRLSDLTLVEELPGLRRAVAVGDGRIAGVFGGGQNEPAELRIGHPGDWTVRKLLGPYAAGRRGASQAADEPEVRFVGRDPRITATKFGIVVADGQAGIVLKFDHQGHAEEPWLSGGATEAELVGYAVERGVVVTARWAARQSNVYLLEDDDMVEVASVYGSIGVATESHVFMFGHDMRVLDADFNEVANEQTLSGFVQAVGAAGNTAVAAGEDFFYVGTAATDGFTLSSVMTKSSVDLQVFVDAIDSELMSAICDRHGIGSYSSQSSKLGGRISVSRLDRPTADRLAAALDADPDVRATRVEQRRTPS